MTSEVTKDDSRVIELSQQTPAPHTGATPLINVDETIQELKSEAAVAKAEQPVAGTIQSRFCLALGRIPRVGSSWTPERMGSQLENVIERVEKLWRDEPGIPFIPEHGPTHNLRMVEVLCEHFAHDLSHLDESEIRVLLAAVWLHDIGMADGLDRKADPDEILDKYPEWSAKYVLDEHFALGLSEDDARVVSTLCSLHKVLKDIATLGVTDPGIPMGVRRQKTLLAYLRLADLLEVRPSRVKGRHLTLFTKNRPLPREVHNEWVRNLFVDGTTRKQETLEVRIQFKRAWGEENIRTLIAGIQNDLQAGLNMVKDVLIGDGQCLLLWVRPAVGHAPPADMEHQMMDALNAWGTARSPNARRVMDFILAGLSQRLGSPDMEAISSYIEGEVQGMLKLRPNMVQIQRLYDDLREVIDSKLDGPAALAELQRVAQVYKDLKDKAFIKIADIAQEHFRGQCCFLVFGYSDCVLAALNGLEEASKKSAHVIVLESRNKSVYSFDNFVDYSDGAEYAIAIRQRGFSNVWLASDVSVPSICEQPSDEARHGFCGPRKPTHVLLGANGVCPRGNIVSTVGHFTVAELAARFGLAVYAVIESDKIGRRSARRLRQREENWLTTDRGLLSRLERAGVQIYKPGEDTVPAAMITYFMTERGVFPPEQLSEKFQDQLSGTSKCQPGVSTPECRQCPDYSPGDIRAA
jgi:translation initiation factor 2B subunit (eIF-2B alpha/beta/delta family)